MANTPPTEQEMTDVFSRFSTPLPPLPQPADDKIKMSDRKKAALVTAAVLLGGGAAFAAVNLGQIQDYFETENAGDAENASPDSPEDTPTADDVVATAATPVQHRRTSAVQNGTITPSENIEIAQKVEPGMAFNEAYAAAREEVGAGGIFSWQGEVYNTYTLEEWQGLSLGQRQEFLGDVGYRPTTESLPVNEGAGEIQIAANDTQETIDVITNAGSGDETDTDGVTDVIVDNESTFPPDVEPAYVEPAYFDLVINGRPALGIDDDHDGIADAIVFIDEATNGIIAFVDAEDDEMIDTIVQFDATTQQIVGQQAIEEPFMAEISQLEAMSELAANPLDTPLAYVASAEADFDDNFEDDDDYTDDSGYVNDAEMPEMD